MKVTNYASSKPLHVVSPLVHSRELSDIMGRKGKKLEKGMAKHNPGSLSS